MGAFTHIDCFAGPGGICTGLKAAGFETRIAIEFIDSCCETYKANHPDVFIINKDIRKVTQEELLPLVPEDGIDLVTSGMPCETFSTAGNTSRSFYDDRQFLFREGIRIATMAKAKFVLFENVPGITSKRVSKNDPMLIVDVLKEELANAGYNNYIDIILSANDFGVPQRRNRYFILATRIPGVVLSAPTPTSERDITVAEAFAGLKNVVPNSGKEEKEYLPIESEYTKLLKDTDFWQMGKNDCTECTYHMPMKHRPATLERFHLLKPGESLKDLFDRYTGDELLSLQEKRILPKKMFIKRNYRLKYEEPSPTVTSHCLDEFVHPIYDRALTVRECARLQSFPDFYDFAGGPYLTPHLHNDIQDKYEQIGDAVPPLLAYAWGCKIGELLKGAKEK